MLEFSGWIGGLHNLNGKKARSSAALKWLACQ
jgi:hypothetical protein